MQVAPAFVQILYSDELCQVANRQIEIDSLQVFRLTEMMRNGKASGSEVAQQEAALAQSRLTATQAQNDRKLALLALTQLLELPSPEGFNIVVPTTVPPLPNAQQLSPDAIYAEAVMLKPEVRAEQFRLEGAAKSIDIARSAKLPTLSFQAGLGSNYYKTSGFPADGFFKQLNNNFSQYLGLSLNVPIFNRYETRNNIRNAELSRQTQLLMLENTKKSLYKEIQQAYYNAVNAQAKYDSSEKALHSQQEAFRLMQAKYEFGKANITEFNETKNNLMKAESDLVRAKYEFVYQSALLDFYRGRPFDF
jgi:outer membrane protein